MAFVLSVTGIPATCTENESLNCFLECYCSCSQLGFVGSFEVEVECIENLPFSLRFSRVSCGKGRKSMQIHLNSLNRLNPIPPTSTSNASGWAFLHMNSPWYPMVHELIEWRPEYPNVVLQGEFRWETFVSHYFGPFEADAWYAKKSLASVSFEILPLTRGACFEPILSACRMWPSSKARDRQRKQSCSARSFEEDPPMVSPCAQSGLAHTDVPDPCLTRFCKILWIQQRERRCLVF